MWREPGAAALRGDLEPFDRGQCGRDLCRLAGRPVAAGARMRWARGLALSRAGAVGGRVSRFRSCTRTRAFCSCSRTPSRRPCDRIVTTVMRPFPAGLMTGAGMVVANPVFCAPALQNLFSRNAYHGTVVWSWQQALFAAGLARQLESHDLPRRRARRSLKAQQSLLWSRDRRRPARCRTRSSGPGPTRRGRYQVAPFGSAAADADESNAAQLWSTVYLAVRPPQATAAGPGRMRIPTPAESLSAGSRR